MSGKHMHIDLKYIKNAELLTVPKVHDICETLCRDNDLEIVNSMMYSNGMTCSGSNTTYFDSGLADFTIGYLLSGNHSINVHCSAENQYIAFSLNTSVDLSSNDQHYYKIAVDLMRIFDANENANNITILRTFST